MKNWYKSLENAPISTQKPLQEAIDQLTFDQQGLIPAIAQEHSTGEILMMAWMNKAALLETLSSKQVCYWSRSRQTLWRKGETSGCTQELIQLRFDCDGDTILLQVKQKGPACHTGRSSCFYWHVDTNHITLTNNTTTT